MIGEKKPLDIKESETPETNRRHFLGTFNKTYITIVIVTVIFTVALIVRLFYVLHNPVPYKDGLGGYGDTPLYHQIAYNLYKGNGFSGIDNGAAYGSVRENEAIEYKPAIVRGPVYPFFMFIVYKFFSDPKDMESIKTWHKNWNKVRIGQGILDATVCIFVFFIVRAIYPASLWPAIISACLYCFSLINIFYTKTLLSENVSTFILSAAILLFIKALQKKENKWWLLAAGMGFGIMVLSRGEYILSLFILAAFIIFIDRRLYSYAVKRVLIFIIGAIIVISPWTARNYIVFKRPILVAESVYGAALFFQAVKWDACGEYSDEFCKDDIEKKELKYMRQEFLRTAREGTIEIKAIDDMHMKKALKIIRENPWRIFKGWIKNIPILWGQSYVKYDFKLPLGVFFIFYFAFAVYAFLAEKKEGRILMGPVFLLFIYLSLVFMPVLVDSRYGVSLLPGIISLSGVGIWKAILRISSMMKNRAGYSSV